MLANANTRLATNDVFYFGHAIGDVNTGNAGAPITVSNDDADVRAIRQNQLHGANSVSVSNIYDVNKDGRVNSIDVSLVRQNRSTLLLRHFTAPVSLRLASSLIATTRMSIAVPSLTRRLSSELASSGDQFFATYTGLKSTWEWSALRA